MIEWLHPGLIFIFGTFLIPLFKGKWKQAYLLILPAAALIDVILMYKGVFGTIPYSTWYYPFLDYELVLGRVDKLSLCFALIFSLAAFCMVLYALHVKSSSEHMSEFFYVGGALGVVFAGDLFTLYIFWEIMAIASMLLIWFHGGRGAEVAHRAGFRYILWHLFGGIVLLAGIIMYVAGTGSTAFNAFSWGWGSEYLPSYLIFFGFILNAAVPPLHAWLPDAYPEATVTGAVFLSAFTTKSAVYVLVRGFTGVDILIGIGAIMTVYPIFYAVLENDIRRVLGYSLINQVGFMLCGIGIGTPLAICGTVSHAFCHIIYKGLLFMSAGSVLQMTGKIKCTSLGGLWKSMPFTTACCMIAAASISAFPGFSGFISKSMIIAEAAHFQLGIVWVLLLLASAGVFHHAGVKVPYFAFFAKDAGIKAKDPPLNMKLAMGIGAFLCIFLGVFPQYLYNILPYDPVALGFIPYTAAHVVSQAQLLMFASLAFYVLIITGVYPPEQKKLNLDTDWPFRIWGAKFMIFCKEPLMDFASWVDRGMKRISAYFASFGRNPLRAIRIALSTMMVKALRTFVLEFWWRVFKYYERDLEEAKKLPADKPIETVPLGTAVLLIIILFLLYLVITLMYGWLAP